MLCLSLALYLQIAKDWYPCALCIAQRYLYLFTALAGLLVGVSAVSRRRTKTFRWSPSVAAALAMMGFMIAAYHQWVLWQPEQTCGAGPLQTWLNNLPWVPFVWVMFEADGLCTDSYPPLLGLSLPMWSTVGFMLQFTLALMAWHASRPFSVFKVSR